MSVMGPLNTRKGREVTMPEKSQNNKITISTEWHTNCHCPTHLQFCGSDIIQEPEEETFNEAPEDPGKHHHNQEEDNFTVFDNLLHIGKDLLTRRFEIQSELKNYPTSQSTARLT